MSIVRYPKFDRFCRFIGALEWARKGTEASSKREAIRQGRQRLVQALHDAGLGELTPDDIQELNTHKAEADREFWAIFTQITNLQERHGVVGDLTMGQILEQVPKSDLGYVAMMHDLALLITDAREAWRLLGREGDPPCVLGEGFRPDERGTILAYALRNRMLD
jgi:hypothetical protein